MADVVLSHLSEDSVLHSPRVSDFDPNARTLRFAGVFLDGLSFPHGIDSTADGRSIAVTNYGNDTLSIARV